MSKDIKLRFHYFEVLPWVFGIQKNPIPLLRNILKNWINIICLTLCSVWRVLERIDIPPREITWALAIQYSLFLGGVLKVIKQGIANLHSGDSTELYFGGKYNIIIECLRKKNKKNYNN